ncbi:MAG: Com family DNA-binding transcriptional regulator [Firmicutes bacterium]|nr:Com family DNA-binding transcriptional regulator [Bacillota bacterium]
MGVAGKERTLGFRPGECDRSLVGGEEVNLLAIKCPECGVYNMTAAEACKKCGAAFKANLATIEPEKTEKKPGLLGRLFGRK